MIYSVLLFLVFLASGGNTLKIPSPFDSNNLVSANQVLTKESKLPADVSYNSNGNLEASTGVYSIVSSIGKFPVIVDLDVTSGNITILAKDSHSRTGPNLGCMDPVNNVYYYVWLSVLHGLNMNDSTLIQSVNLSDYIIGCASSSCGSRITCDTNTGDVYVWGFASDDPTYFTRALIRVSHNIKTGETIVTKVKEYAGFGPCDVTSAPPSTFDTQRNRLWISAWTTSDDSCSNPNNSYYNIDATTGDMISSVLSTNWDLFTLNYAASFDSLVSMVLSDDGTTFRLEFFDPVTANSIKKYSNFDGNTYDALYLISTIDTTNNILYFVPCYESCVIAGVSLDTGMSVTEAPFVYALDSLAYYKV